MDDDDSILFRTVVLQPGSRSILFGLATDPSPRSAPACLAHRRRAPLPLPPSLDPPAPAAKPLQTARDALRAVWASQRYVAARGQALLRASKTAAAANLTDETDAAAAASERYRDLCSGLTVLPLAEDAPTVLVGDDALRAPEDEYERTFPFHRGLLHVWAERRGRTSATAVDDARTLLRHVVVDLMGLAPGKLRAYSVVIVIPDLFDRRDVSALMDICLHDLGFSQALPCQSSVCVAFAAAKTSACVVDIGHEKTSVCLVEDGLLQSKNRIVLPYGGRHITDLLASLLVHDGDGEGAKVDLPAGSMQHAALEWFKEVYCTLDPTLLFAPARELLLVGKDAATLRLGDYLVLPPVALFYPDALPGIELLRGPHTGHIPSDGMLDEALLLQDGRYGPRTEKTEARERDILESSAVFHPAATPQELADVLPLHEAIVECFRGRTPAEGVRRKESETVLVSGGVAKTPGLVEAIEARISHSLAQMRCGQPEVVAVYKSSDPQHAGWRGGCIMASCGSVGDCFVAAAAWRKTGVLALRERAVFVW